MPEITVYKNEPYIEEIIDKDYNTDDGKLKIKGKKLKFIK